MQILKQRSQSLPLLAEPVAGQVEKIGSVGVAELADAPRQFFYLEKARIEVRYDREQDLACPAVETPDESGASRHAPDSTEELSTRCGITTHQDERCECGSGLRRRRCCELDRTYTAPLEEGERIDFLADRAAKAFAEGDTAAAEATSLQVLEMAPLVPAALWTLYQLRQRAGRERAALALLQRLVTVEPNRVDATQDLAMLLFRRGDLVLAEHHARNAVRLAPTHPQSHNLMAMILTETQRPHAGEFHYRRVLELSAARAPILLANLAWNLKCQGRIAEARELYKESIGTAPNVVQTLFGWGQLEEADGNFDAARTALDRAAQLDPDHQGLRVARATLLARQGRLAAAADELGHGQGGERNGRSAETGADSNALLERGRILDRLERYDEAFACFDEAKRLAREITGKSYLDQQARDIADRLRGFFVSERMQLMPRAALRKGHAQPIFVLGFPRSGTTLVEQALSRHPKISAGDELPFIAELGELIPKLFNSPLAYPEALAEFWMGDNRLGPDALRDAYLRKAELRRIICPDSSYFTDKMPLNEMHLGLISLVFPRSPLIHVLRHPLDVVLSVYAHHLTHGYFCAYALETIAQHYVLVMDLVHHYRTQLALRYLPVRYEDMVADMSSSVRRMLDFIGESFDERCVNFHENRRLPQTPSYAQVAEKLYDRARFRYRHYRKHLEPVIPILKPVMERLGYAVD